MTLSYSDVNIVTICLNSPHLKKTVEIVAYMTSDHYNKLRR